MNPDQLEKLYRDTLPSHFRDRYDFERFKQLSTDPVREFGAPSADTAEAFRTERVQLPKLEDREVGGLACKYGVKVEATWIPSILERGCFGKATKDGVKVLYGHMQPIGIPTYLKDLPVGLAVVGKISKTTWGEDAIVLARDGVIDMFSVGFMPTEYYYKEDKETKEIYRHITEGELYEFSLVARGACPGAKITDVHSALGFLDPRMDRVLELLEGKQPKALSFADLQRTVEAFELDDAGIDLLVAKLTARKKASSAHPAIDLGALDDLERLVGAGG